MDLTTNPLFLVDAAVEISAISREPNISTAPQAEKLWAKTAFVSVSTDIAPSRSKHILLLHFAACLRHRRPVTYH